MTQGFSITNNDGVVTLTLKIEGKVNKLGPAFGEALTTGFDEALASEGLKGIIITSGHRDFCVGADLDMVFAQRDPQSVFDACNSLHALFRKIETSGTPVVAALNGTALGGGYELALACHHRVAVNSPKLLVGLPPKPASA